MTGASGNRNMQFGLKLKVLSVRKSQARMVGALAANTLRNRRPAQRPSVEVVWLSLEHFRSSPRGNRFHAQHAVAIALEIASKCGKAFFDFKKLSNRRSSAGMLSAAASAGL